MSKTYYWKYNANPCLKTSLNIDNCPGGDLCCQESCKSNLEPDQRQCQSERGEINLVPWNVWREVDQPKALRETQGRGNINYIVQIRCLRACERVCVCVCGPPLLYNSAKIVYSFYLRLDWRRVTSSTGTGGRSPRAGRTNGRQKVGKDT